MRLKLNNKDKAFMDLHVKTKHSLEICKSKWIIKCESIKLNDLYSTLNILDFSSSYGEYNTLFCALVGLKNSDNSMFSHRVFKGWLINDFCWHLQFWIPPKQTLVASEKLLATLITP